MDLERMRIINITDRKAVLQILGLRMWMRILVFQCGIISYRIFQISFNLFFIMKIMTLFAIWYCYFFLKPSQFWNIADPKARKVRIYTTNLNVTEICSCVGSSLGGRLTV